MISLDFCLNFQAGVVIIVHVSEYKLHESIYTDDLIHRASFCLKFCLHIFIIIFLSSLYNNQHM